MCARGLGLETDTSSEVCVINELTVFNGLSGDKASSINSWLSTMLAATPLIFIKSVGLITYYVITHAVCICMA